MASDDMGFIGKLLGTDRHDRSRSSDLHAALEAVGIDASHDRWNGSTFEESGRAMTIDASNASFVDVRIEQPEVNVGAGPDAPVIWNEEPGGARETWVDDDGAPLPDLLLEQLRPALSPVVAAGAHSIRVERAMMIAVFPTDEHWDAAAFARRIVNLMPTLHRTMDGIEGAYAEWSRRIDP